MIRKTPVTRCVFVFPSFLVHALSHPILSVAPRITWQLSRVQTSCLFIGSRSPPVGFRTRAEI